jgi:hypothetical protein
MNKRTLNPAVAQTSFHKRNAFRSRSREQRR